MRGRIAPAESALLTLAAALGTVVMGYAAVRYGPQLGFGAALGVAVFLGLVLLFVNAPHAAFAFAVTLFAVLPALKVFVAPQVGPAKEVVIAAAGVAALLAAIFDQRRADRWTIRLAGLLLLLYLVNAGGSHDAAWREGVRLTLEPLVLLAAGMILPDPRRTFAWLTRALIVAACAAAAYGVLQQYLGPTRLVSLGYEYDLQVRFTGSHFRSFGFADDPFGYAGLLVLAIGAALFAPLAPGRRLFALGLLLLGLLFAFVTTDLLILAAVGGAVLARRGQGVPAAIVTAGLSIALLTVLVVQSGGVESRRLAVPTAQGGTELQAQAGTVDVLLNGRVSAWSAAVGDSPRNWALGRGVGEVGTAAARAQTGYVPTASGTTAGSSLAVDSGYFATLADVGIPGLAVLLALFGRLLALSYEAARRGRTEGWVALVTLLVLLLDAASRASFTGFPTAYVALALVGVSLAAARVRDA